MDARSSLAKLKQLMRKLQQKDNDGFLDAENLLHNFRTRCDIFDQPKVLELGTMRSVPTRPTHHTDWVPNAGEYLGTDIAPGVDVDIVADVHRLTETTGAERFDVIISCSSFEHFKYPHLAAHEIMKALKVGGILLIQTHQTFPIHAYPYDYFRFSKEALTGLFGTKMNFKTLQTAYQFRTRILSRRVKNALIPNSFLNVLLYGEKTGKTPDTYIYELDIPDN